MSSCSLVADVWGGWFAGLSPEPCSRSQVLRSPRSSAPMARLRRAVGDPLCFLNPRVLFYMFTITAPFAVFNCALSSWFFILLLVIGFFLIISTVQIVPFLQIVCHLHVNNIKCLRIQKCCLVCDDPERIMFNPSWATCTMSCTIWLFFSAKFRTKLTVLPVHEHVNLCAEDWPSTSSLFGSSHLWAWLTTTCDVLQGEPEQIQPSTPESVFLSFAQTTVTTMANQRK